MKSRILTKLLKILPEMVNQTSLFFLYELSFPDFQLCNLQSISVHHNYKKVLQRPFSRAMEVRRVVFNLRRFPDYHIEHQSADTGTTIILGLWYRCSLSLQIENSKTSIMFANFRCCRK